MNDSYSTPCDNKTEPKSFESAKNTEEHHESSYSAFLPAYILDDDRLNADEKITFAHIGRFLKRDGYATCSDAWLANKNHCNERKIQRNLKSLEEAGYIYRHTVKIGMYWKRRIWLATEYAIYLEKNGLEDEGFKKCLRTDPGVGFEQTLVSVPSRRGCRHNTISTKEEKQQALRTREADAIVDNSKRIKKRAKAPIKPSYNSPVSLRHSPRSP